MSEALASRGYIADSSGGGPSAPTLTVGVDTIDVNWLTNVAITTIGQAVSNWAIATVVGQPVTVLTVIQVNPTTTRLTTTDQTLGGSYILDVPAAAAIDAITSNPNAFFTLSFVGDGHLPSLVSVAPQSTTTVLVTFSEPVNVAEALAAGHYNIDNGLLVSLVSQVSTTQFLLTTNEMGPSIIYTVTVSGIHDLAGNPVT